MIDPETVDTPLFTTIVGGLVEKVNGLYCFLEVPNGFELVKVGDPLPPGWSLIPTNAAALRIMDQVSHAS